MATEDTTPNITGLSAGHVPFFQLEPGRIYGSLQHKTGTTFGIRKVTKAFFSIIPERNLYHGAVVHTTLKHPIPLYLSRILKQTDDSRIPYGRIGGRSRQGLWRHRFRSRCFYNCRLGLLCENKTWERHKTDE